MGLNSKSKTTWRLVNDKLQKRLAIWKSKYMSMSGCLTLLKVAFEIYHFTLCQFFRFRKESLKRLKSKASFFCGVAMLKPRRFILLIGILCKVLVKNMGLLNKWLWRYGNETNSLWRRVLCKKNDVDENSLLLNINNTRKLSTV